MDGLDQVRPELARSRAATRLGWVVAALAIAACDRPAVDRDGGAVSSDTSDPRNKPGYIIDSIFPPEEAMRRFRLGLSEVKTLDGPRTRDELVQRFMRAVEAKDAAALDALVINRREFAYLIYPESKLSKPPYRQPPEIAWTLLQAGTGGGAQKLLNKAAPRFRLLGYRCAASAGAEGAMRVHSGCVVRVREGGVERDVRMFGRIVERDGRWKFISLESDL